MDLYALIAQVGEKVDSERKSIKENSGWVVQYFPCGHAIEITHKNPLVEKCKSRKQIDALILPSKQCPVCNEDIWDDDLHLRELL